MEGEGKGSQLVSEDKVGGHTGKSGKSQSCGYSYWLSRCKVHGVVGKLPVFGNQIPGSTSPLGTDFCLYKRDLSF